MTRRRKPPGWLDTPRVARVAVRHDMEEILLARIRRAERASQEASERDAPAVEVQRLLKRVATLRSLLRRTEILP